MYLLLSGYWKKTVKRLLIFFEYAFMPVDVDVLTRTVRENWIKAKYIQKSFVSQLPGPKSSDSKIKGWRVKKKTRRSPGRTLDPGEEGEKSSPDSDVTSGLLEGTYICVDIVYTHLTAG